MHKVINFKDFEELFKLGQSGGVSPANSEIDGTNTNASKRYKKPELTSLLDHNRLRNIGKF